MIRCLLIPLALLSLANVAVGEDDGAGGDLPPIVEIAGLQPERDVFEGSSAVKPLVIESKQDAERHLGSQTSAKLQEQVNFDRQYVLVFAWRGSGQDKLTHQVAGSKPEQVVFRYAPGRTRDLRPHLQVFAVRSGVKWRMAPQRPAAAGRRPNPAMARITDDPQLPRVLLIGDSISIGYTLPTRRRLQGKANVHRPLTNCGPTTKGLAELDQWLGDGKWDVIHFNWGLHDLKYLGPNGENLADPKSLSSRQQVPIDQYEQNLDKLVARLKETGAKLIWRNTTPVPPGSQGRVVGDSARYNEAAARVMQKYDVATHDLYSLSKERMAELMLKANVHFTPEGSEALGAEVAKVIEAALQARPETP